MAGDAARARWIVGRKGLTFDRQTGRRSGDQVGALSQEKKKRRSAEKAESEEVRPSATAREQAVIHSHQGDPQNVNFTMPNKENNTLPV